MFEIQFVKYLDDPSEGAIRRAPYDNYFPAYDDRNDEYLHSAECFHGFELLQEYVGGGFSVEGELDNQMWQYFVLEPSGVVGVNEDLYIQPVIYPPVSEDLCPTVIYIDPFNAFGDGRHPTTSLCLRYLVEHLCYISPEDRMKLSLLDAGAGTGILSIAAEKLGVGAIDAVELNIPAVESARKNIEMNKCVRVNVQQGDIHGFTGSGRYSIILANIITDVIISCIQSLAKLLHPDGIMIVSGISARRAREAERHFFDNGLTVSDSACLDGWNGYLLRLR